MDRKLYYGQDAEFRKRADQVIDEIASGHGQYYDAEELADISDYFAINNMPDKMQMVVEYGLHLHPESTELMIQEAFLYLDAGDLDKTEKCIERISPFSNDVKQLKAIFAYRKGNIDQADELLNEMVADFQPGDTYSIVSLMLDLDRPDEALEFLIHSDEDPDDEFYLDNLVSCYRDLDMLDDAIKTMNRLIDKHPYQPHLWKVLGECYYDRGLYDKGIEACDFALTTDEEYYPAMTLKALCFTQLGNAEKALESVRQAYPLGGIPLAGLIYFEASYYFTQKQYGEIIKVYSLFLDEAKNEPTLLNTPYTVAIATIAAHAYLILNEWDKAFKLADDLIAHSESNAELWLVIAVVHMKEGNKEEFKRGWEKFRNSDDLTIDLLREASNYCMTLNENHEAFLNLQFAHNMDPENKQINLMYFTHSAAFAYNQAFDTLIQTVDFKLPKERLMEIKWLLQDHHADPMKLMNATLELTQAYYPELFAKALFSDEEIAEYARLVEESRDATHSDLENKLIKELSLKKREEKPNNDDAVENKNENQ